MSDQQELDEIKKVVVGLAAWYDKTLDDDQLKMYSHRLKQKIGAKKLIQAARIYTDDPRNSRFPLPAQLISLVSDTNDDMSIARILTPKLINAVARKGRSWFSMHPDKEPQEILEEEFGELGAKVIELWGGWGKFHEFANSGADNTIISAQIREFTISVLKMARLGKLDEKPSLVHESGASQMNELVGNCLNQIENNAKN